jgi:hypothetical protein
MTGDDSTRVTGDGVAGLSAGGLSGGGLSGSGPQDVGRYGTEARGQGAGVGELGRPRGADELDDADGLSGPDGAGGPGGACGPGGGDGPGGTGALAGAVGTARAGGAGTRRAQVRVVRPGGSGRRDGGIPPMPVAPPSVLPPWLSAGSGAAAEGFTATGNAAGNATGNVSGNAAGSVSGNVAGNTAASGTPAAAPEPAEPAEAGLSPGESELRELLHRSVSDLRPTPGSLETLRRAVPLRRARRRRCGGVVGALALGVLGGLVLHSLAGTGDSPQGSQSGPGYQNAATSSAAGSGHATPSTRTVAPYLPPPAGAGGTWSATAGAGAPSGTATGSRSGSVAPGTSGAAAPGFGNSGGTSVAECTRGQLGSGGATVGTADADGTTYGSFQVANVSQTTCEVSLPGTVTVVSASGTSASWISVVQHSATDPATLLPAPAATPSPVLLAPGQSYVVDFAWVPTTSAGAPSCGVGSASPSASPTVSPPGGGATDAASGSASDGQGGATPPASPPPTGQPSITLAHTPGAGGPAVASAVLPGACAGTVYDTLPLATG